MKKINIIILIIGILLFTCWILNCIIIYLSNQNIIKVWDNIRCWDLVSYQFDVVVVYKDGNYLYWTGTMNETIYWDTDMNSSWYWYRLVTGAWAFNVIEDDCFRTTLIWEAIDKIRIYKKIERKNK